MKPNKYLTEEQRQYIGIIKTKTDTKSMDLGVAHEIVVLENSIKNFTDALTHANNRFEMMTQKHNDNGFGMLKRLVRRRDDLARSEEGE